MTESKIDDSVPTIAVKWKFRNCIDFAIDGVYPADKPPFIAAIASGDSAKDLADQIRRATHRSPKSFQLTICDQTNAVISVDAESTDVILLKLGRVGKDSRIVAVFGNE